MSESAISNFYLSEMLYYRDNMWSVSFAFSNGQISPEPGIYLGEASSVIKLPKEIRNIHFDTWKGMTNYFIYRIEFDDISIMPCDRSFAHHGRNTISL